MDLKSGGYWRAGQIVEGQQLERLQRAAGVVGLGDRPRHDDLRPVRA
jgi:hypothetical protein